MARNSKREVFRIEDGKKVAVVRLASEGTVLFFTIWPLAGQEPYSLTPTREECEQLLPDGDYEVREMAGGFFTCRKGEKNFFGMDPHPSDAYVHWTRRNHNPNFEEEIAELRAAWDQVHSNPRLARAASLLAQWKVDLYGSLKGEDEAGEDL